MTTAADKRDSIPAFTVVVSVVMILMGVGFGLRYWFDTAAAAQVDVGDRMLLAQLHMLGTRALTMALALLLALVYRNRMALLIVLVMRVVTEILDGIAVMSMPAAPAAAPYVVVAIIVAEVIAIVLLWRRAPAAL